MPDTDQEVFEHFQNLAGDNFEIGLMAYARYAQEKYDWVIHKRVRDGNPPSDEDTTRWITELTNSHLDGIYSGAISQFRAAAEDYMRPRIEEERTRAVESSILSRVEAAADRVERATSFRRRFLPDLLMAVIASLVLAVLLVIAATAIRGDPILGMLRELLTTPKPDH